MAYTKQTWADGNPAYPLSAARMNHIETGIKDAHDLIASAGGGGGGAALIVVASVDAPSAVKAAASYVCDGTADQVEINAAIAQAAPLKSRNSAMPDDAEQLGQVLLTGGRFNISGPIQMRTAVSLIGSGWATELRAVGNNGLGVVTLAAPNDHICHVQNLWLNGNYASGGTCDGINFDMTGSGNTSGYPGTNPDSDHYISNLLVTGFTTNSRNGIKLWASGTANNRGNIISDCQLRDIAGNGIWLAQASDSFITTCHVGGAGNAGFRVEAGNTKIMNAKSFYCDTYGFYVGSGRHTLTNAESQDDATGYYLSATDAVYSGIVADTSNADGIVVAAAGTVINGFQVFNRSSGRYSSTSNGIRLTSTHADVSLIGRVNPTRVTTKVSGTAGARSFVRISDGSTLVSAG